MSLADLRGLLGDPQAHLEAISPLEPSDECTYLISSAVPQGLGFMFSRGRLVRIDIRQAGIRTASGGQIGDSEASIKSLYPNRITEELHPYDDQGHYLVYTPVDAADAGYSIIFETDGEKVTSFRIGLQGPVALIEGCA